jgi:D-alanine-D-alanine ligase
MDQRKQVAILFGGRSPEHEISIITALQLISAIDTTKIRPIPVYIAHSGKWFTGNQLLEKAFYSRFEAGKVVPVTILPQPTLGLTRLDTQEVINIDVAFLAFHGEFGEDGCIQGLLELAKIPYTSGTVLSMSLAMHKHHCKTLVSALGIPVLPGTLVHRHEAQHDLDAVLENFHTFPLFVKPNHLGSSIGIGCASDRASLISALANVFQYDRAAIVEPQVTNILEVNISILGDKASPLEVPVASDEMLTYEDKYLRGGKGKGSMEGMASLTRVIGPQDLDPKIENQVRLHAFKAYRELECLGPVRFDFLVDCDTDQLYFNELNPIPGSLAFYLWERMNPPMLYTDLIEETIAQAEVRHARRHAVRSDLGFRALAAQA